MQRTEKTERINIADLEFADDLELVAPSIESLQKMITIMDDLCRNFGLTISHKKTVVMAIEAPATIKKGKNKETIPPPPLTIFEDIILHGKPIQRVETFCYLGRILNANGELDAELNNRMNRMTVA
jgi:hypothetical protein